MTFTEPSPHESATPDEPTPRKPATRPRTRGQVAVAPPIRTRLVPHCAWPTEADALPARRGKRR